MLFLRFIWAGLALAAFIAPAAFTQEVVNLSTQKAVDLSTIYNAALENDARFAGRKANFKARLTLVPQAKSALLPNLSVSGSYRRTWSETLLGARIPQRETVTQAEYTRRNWQASLRQPVIDFGLWFSLDGARALSEQAKIDFAMAKQNLIVRAVSAYLDILAARDLLNSTEAEELAFKRQLDRALQRFEAGLVATTDVLEARAAYDSAVARRIQAQSDQLIVFAALTAITNHNFEAVGRLSADLPILNPQPQDAEEWVRRALQQNWAIKSRQAALQAANLELRSRRAARLPAVGLTAQYNTNMNDNELASTLDNEVIDRMVQVQVDMPIFLGGGLIARINEARFSREEARQALIEQQRNTIRDTRNLYQQVVAGVYRVQATKRAAVSARSALEATRNGYEAGTRTIVDVLQAERNLYQSQLNYATTRYGHVLNVLRLKDITGMLVDKDVHDLNNFVQQQRPVGFLPPIKPSSGTESP